MELNCELTITSDANGKVRVNADGGAISKVIGTIKAANPAPAGDGSVRADHGKGNKVPDDTPHDAVIAFSASGSGLDIGVYSTFDTVPKALAWLAFTAIAAPKAAT